MTSTSTPRTRSPILAGRLVDYWFTVYRRTWKGTVISSFVTPLLYVLAMGVLLGGFVKSDPEQLEGATSYLSFVAPGMLAAHAMGTVFGEVTYPVMSMLKWQKVYYSMIATPLAVRDLVISHLGFVLFRVATSCLVFTLVLWGFGVFESPVGVPLAFATQLLLGTAFAAPLYALTSGLRDESAFPLIFRLGMIPLFLFSGAFFPIANLSPVLETLARVTPLWHGVDLARMLTTGNVDARMVAIHLAYLTTLSVVGYLLAVRRLARRLAD